MKRGLFLLICVLAYGIAFCQVDTSQQKVNGRKNSVAQQKKPYVILISADGFRYDYAEKYNTQHLLQLANSGVKARHMLPSYPTLTFPNHYAMVTGLTPAHSGLVGNNFYDPKRQEFYYSNTAKKYTDGTWYGGTPLWVLAEKQQMVSATYFWVGSEAEIQQYRPTYYYNYNEKTEISHRIGAVVNWLKLPAEQRPHLITFYLPEVDHESHRHTPDSKETEEAVHFIDSAVYELTKAVKTTGLDVNFIFVSDHGMIKADTANAINLPALVDTTKYRTYGDVPLAELYAKPGADIKADYKALKKKSKGQGFKVYLKTNTPSHLKYSSKDDTFNRIGDILIMPDAPNVIQFGKYKIKPGQHGYDVKQVPEMRATFYAWGPAFKKGLTIMPFNNVDVYNLIANILGLEVTEKVDGNNKLAKKVLVKK
ncbi:alkaline phosphatase family protein [Mucilaginibacter limnophilus]|uniref:Alkaline phosphatase family protein n=1 Tax=Mucilaginibacter limnophilus TaxID=1932778 RepID=A0A3S2V5R5_9SPHI|nr:ectonucleotide pyrophosphatase/phosphodiesterase [Mucilaginibacter limnophilus]RVT96567.1 alkaline phosphatase family protein [Mucilaginibacter limnophilus]